MRLRFFITCFIFISFLYGCSYEKDRVIAELVADERGKYAVYISDQGFPSNEFQKQVSPLVNQSTYNKLEKLVYINSDKKEYAKYKKIFNLDKYPAIVVFDNSGVVLQSNEVEDLLSFFKISNRTSTGS